MKYQPLDAVLDLPGTRLLRALRWFDWTTPNDLFAAAGIPDYTCDVGWNPERNAASAALSRMVTSGWVERGQRSTEGYAHRITGAGLCELRRRLGGVSPLRGSRRKRRAA